MGNSQKSLKSRVKGLFNKEQSPNSRIGKPSECPNCHMQFNEKTTYHMVMTSLTQYNLHLEQCLASEPAELNEPEM
jgi:hypothetical protein